MIRTHGCGDKALRSVADFVCARELHDKSHVCKHQPGECSSLHWGHHDEQHSVSEFMCRLARKVAVNLDVSAESKTLQRPQEAQAADEDSDRSEPQKADQGIEIDAELLCEDEEIEDDAGEDIGEVRPRAPFTSVTEAVEFALRKSELDAAYQAKRCTKQQTTLKEYHAMYGSLLFASFPLPQAQGPTMRWEDHLGLQLRKDFALAIEQQRQFFATALRGASVEVEAEGDADGDYYVQTTDADATVAVIPLPLRMQGPSAVAWHLCQAANLNEEQVDAVALVARQLQQMWPQRTETGMLPASWGKENCQVMFLGGGGCGKTHTLLHVIKPLVQCYFGCDGFEGQCPSNAGARLFGGRTVHSSLGLSATSSLKVEQLGLKGKGRTKVEKICGPAGALVIDEVSQLSAAMLHANALRHTYGRSRRHGLQVDRYMSTDELFGRMPIVILSGDYLQLPPVPESSSVLWPHTQASYEHRQGRSIIDRTPLVFQFEKANRFTDDRLLRILHAMRTSGGQKIREDDWQALCGRLLTAAVSKGGCVGPPDVRLVGAADWLESSYDWLTVSLAIHLRTRMAAHAAEKVLFYIVAVDLPPFEIPPSMYKALLAVPNVTTTKKLPGILPIYIGARVRLTKTLLVPHLVPEREGLIVGIELHEQDHAALLSSKPRKLLIEDGSVLLQCLPKSIYVRFDDLDPDMIAPQPCLQHAVVGAERGCLECQFYTGIVAILPEMVEWTYKQTAPPCSARSTGQKTLTQIVVRRRQFPLLPALPKTLHSLQGVTAKPGLLAHFRLPSVSVETKWLAYYVMLSRPRSLETLLCHGLPDRGVLEAGPPTKLQEAMDALFQPKIAQTRRACSAARREVGWPEGAAAKKSPANGSGQTSQWPAQSSFERMRRRHDTEETALLRRALAKSRASQ